MDCEIDLCDHSDTKQTTLRQFLIKSNYDLPVLLKMEEKHDALIKDRL